MYIQGKYLLAGLHDVSECFAIRKEVFLEEQGFSSAAAEDAEDKSAIFALVYEAAGKEALFPVGTGRLVFLGDQYRIGRIAVRKEFRRKKYGDFLVRMLVDKAFSMGAREVYVGAQEHAVPFYESIGFVKQDEAYEEDGILHQMMKIMPHTCKRECRQ